MFEIQEPWQAYLDWERCHPEIHEDDEAESLEDEEEE